jgi:hypothetical protein
VRPDGAEISGVPVVVTVVRRTLRWSDNRIPEWSDTTVRTDTVRSGERSVLYSFVPTVGGSYQLRFAAEDGRGGTARTSLLGWALANGGGWWARSEYDLPLIVAEQLLLTLGLALMLSALTVHFRDLRDLLANLLTLAFFLTPIIYPLSQAPAWARPFLNLNPFTTLAVSYQEVLAIPGPFLGWPRLIAFAAVSVVVLAAGYFVFDRLRDSLAEEV